MKKQSRPTAYGYRRRSNSREDKISLEAQGSQIRTYHRHKFHGCQPAVPLVMIDDEGVSGGLPLFSRPDGKELLNKLKPGDHFIIAKLDRAWRSLSDGATMLHWMIEQGIHLHALDIDVDSSTPAGRMCLHVMMALAQMERERIGERRRDSNTERRSRGLPWFVCPYPPLGWLIIRDKYGQRVFFPNHKERKQLRRLLAMHERGLGYRRLEQRLHQLGWTNRQGNPWTRSGIRRALFAVKNGFPQASGDAQKWGSLSDQSPQWHRHPRSISRLLWGKAGAVAKD